MPGPVSGAVADRGGADVDACCENGCANGCAIEGPDGAGAEGAAVIVVEKGNDGWPPPPGSGEALC